MSSGQVNNLKHYLHKSFGPTLQRFAFKSGIMKFTASISKLNGSIILMYHSVADDHSSRWIDPANHVSALNFERQMDFISKRKNVISLQTLINTLRSGGTIEPNTVAITFDDGYLDNLTVAAPIIEYYKLKATIFLPTDYIDNIEQQWIDNLYSIFKYRTKHKLHWHDDEQSIYDLNNLEKEQAIYRTVCNELMLSNYNQRKILLDILNKQLQPYEVPPRLTMSWSDIRTLVSKYNSIDIGGHTAGHIDLTSVSEEEAKK